jgi:hypothetical protein
LGVVLRGATSEFLVMLCLSMVTADFEGSNIYTGEAEWRDLIACGIT